MKAKVLVVVLVVLSGYLIFGRGERKPEENSLAAFLADTEERAAGGDQLAEFLLDGVKELEENGDLSGLDKSRAASVLLPVAESGNVRVQAVVGKLFYETGEMEKAAYWFEQAAAGGDASSCFFLSNMYMYGEGVEQDNEKMLYYLERAGEAGDVEAQLSLAMLYQSGAFGAGVDYEKMRYWAEHAAEQGDCEAQGILGNMYFYGQGTDIDYGKAQKWLELAAEEIYEPKLWCGVGALYLNLNDVFPGAVIDHEKAYYYYKKSYDSGELIGAFSLGTLYYNGLHVKQDYAMAFKLFTSCENASNNTLPPKIRLLAQYYIGYMYLKGQYVEKDINEAVKWLKLSANNHNEVAYYALGRIYERGDGVDKDLELALEYYKNGAELGDMDSAERLRILSESK